MSNTPTNSPSANAVNFWLWLFPLTYIIHIAEEYFVGEGYPAYILRLRGVHMSTTRFLVAQSVGLVLVTIGVILSRRFNFPKMMLIILGTIVMVNGITHTVTALSIMEYGPGLWSSIFIWLPLGLLTLVRFRKANSAKRFWIAFAIGVGVNIVVGVLTMRGARVV